MSAAEIEAHRVFLTGLGTASREIDLTINVIQSTLRGDEVAIPDHIIPLMPATWVRDYVEGDRRQYERRPHLWSAADRNWFAQRASFYELAAIVMDLRAGQGDGAATGAADVVREPMRVSCGRSRGTRPARRRTRPTSRRREPEGRTQKSRRQPGPFIRRTPP